MNKLTEEQQKQLAIKQELLDKLNKLDKDKRCEIVKQRKVDVKNGKSKAIGEYL